MRTIALSKPQDPKLDFSYVELNTSHFDEVLTESAQVVDHEGKIVFTFLKRALSPDSVRRAWNGIEDWWPMTNQRHEAQGQKPTYIYKDGKKTNLKSGKRSYACSGVAGYFDRFPTCPACRPCAFNADAPEKFEMLFPLTQEVQALHKEHDPAGWLEYEKFKATCHPDWMVAGTPYTSLTVNKNFQTFPHKDGFNLQATCPMTIIRKGKYRGGTLVFPEWRIAVDIDTTDLILFMNSQQWHGNTKITKLNADAIRCSIIWYCRKGMTNCLGADEEITRLKDMNIGPIRGHRDY